MNDEFDSRRKNRGVYNKKKLVKGVGINDADYVIEQRINGKRLRCPFYTRWISMLDRCYSSQFQERYPTYKGCYVHNDWLTFSTFKSWMENQDWEGKHLDKDILIEGNKLYSSDTCAFVTSEANNFLTERVNARGSLPIGVSLNQGKYRARCKDKGNEVFLGHYDSPEAAHMAWYTHKVKLAKQLASEQTDLRVAEALLSRFPETIY